MEHLPLPRGAELNENDIVPYISSTDYLGVPFLSYPQNKGYEHAIPQPDRPNFSTHEGVHPTPNDQLASFLQTWLFFGMLQEALGSLYRHEDFVRSCESKKGPMQVLTTAKLTLLLTERFSFMPAADDEHTSLSAHIRECIIVAGNATTIIPSRLSREISFSILATLETLSSTFNAYLSTNFSFPLAWVSSLPRDYWIKQMCLNNWCAREAAIASANFNSAQALHYLSKVKKYYKDDCHRHCTQEECEGMQIDLAKYEPRHYDPHCSCSIISIDSERLNNILVRISRDDFLLLKAISGLETR
jgi:hypothetical protein